VGEASTVGGRDVPGAVCQFGVSFSENKYFGKEEEVVILNEGVKPETVLR
jgi:hypothetical protein